jgi:hypothetical protein
MCMSEIEILPTLSVYDSFFPSLEIHVHAQPADVSFFFLHIKRTRLICRYCMPLALSPENPCRCKAGCVQ